MEFNDHIQILLLKMSTRLALLKKKKKEERSPTEKGDTV